MGRTKLAIDVGGTFTDLFLLDEDTGELRTAKVWSTPGDPGPVVDGLAKIGTSASDLSDFIHATTAGINAVVTRTGARTGLLHTSGHRDILDMGRAQRPVDSLWDLAVLRPHLVRPLVARRDRYAVRERILADGSILWPLEENDVLASAEALIAEGIESIAITYLNSYLNPCHEIRSRELISAAFPDVDVFTSAELFPVFRELYRTTATTINAYVSPKVDRYVEALERSLVEGGFAGTMRVTKCDGGSATTAAVRGRGVDTIHSGPAAGVTAALHLGRAVERRSLLVIDIGGTTADISIITEGVVDVTLEYAVEHDLFIGVPAVDVRSIGAGGGSIAWIDTAGALNVGPHSAAAVPGPVAYGRGGTQPTVTDAHLVRGTILAEHFLGGEVAIDVAAARGAIGLLGAQLGLTSEATAQGILDIMEVKMAGALRAISTYRGKDPRDYALVAIGAAGPLHGSALAHALGIGEVIIPRWPGEFSAFGLLAAGQRVDVARGVARPLGDLEPNDVTAVFEALELDARRQLTAQGVGEADISLTRWMDALYVGQARDIACELLAVDRYDRAALAGLTEAFVATYQSTFGNLLHAPVKVSAFRVTATAPPCAPPLQLLDAPSTVDAPARTTTIHGGAGPMQAPVIQRDTLGAGAKVTGPALVIQPTATTYLQAGDRLTVDELGNLRIDCAGKTEGSQRG